MNQTKEISATRKEGIERTMREKPKTRKGFASLILGAAQAIHC